MSTQDQLALLRGAVAVPKESTPEMRKALNEAIDTDRSGYLLNPSHCIEEIMAASPPAYAEALSALLDGYEAMQWQPIETAPKGVEILVWFSALFGGMADSARWDDDRYAKNPRPYWSGKGIALYGITAYRNGKPTQWMPLPAAPVALTKQGEKA